jgi:predicted  nucleic acid-binding Zn-ribbon protein
MGGSSGGGSKASDWKQVELMQEQNKLQKANTVIQGQQDILNVNTALLGMEESLAQYDVDIQDYGTQIQSYDQWLGNYQNLYAMETGTKDAEIAQFKQSGLESYNNFMDALGGADAAAGMTGRVGAGTSAQAVTGRIDQALAAFAGEDRSLEGDDGTYGMQAKVQDLQKQDLITSLENQKTSMEGQKQVAGDAVTRMEQAKARTNDAIAAANVQKGQLETFVGELTDQGIAEREKETQAKIDKAVTDNTRKYQQEINKYKQEIYQLKNPYSDTGGQ